LPHRRNSLGKTVNVLAAVIWTVLNYGQESVSVGFGEIRSQDWGKKVYRPDIQDKWDKLYKKPGDEM
jgi:4-oxalocrotonate tautomerase